MSEASDFGFAEGAPFAGFELAEFDGADANAFEAEHIASDAVKHEADLAFDALGEDDFVAGVPEMHDAIE